MPCGCPDAVFSVLSNFVNLVLQQVQQVLYFRGALANLEGAVSDDTAAAVEDLANQIPLAPGLSLTDVASFATCTLLPTALTVLAYQARKRSKDPTAAAEEFARAPATAQLDRVREMYRYYANDLNSEWNAGLQGLQGYNAIRSARQYLDSAKQVGLVPDALSLARAVTLQVQGECPESYAGSVFERFDLQTSTFVFDGLVPGGFDGPMGRATRALSDGDARVGAWRQMSVAV